MIHNRRLTLRIACALMCLFMCMTAALADDYDVDLYTPDTAIATAPIIMQAVSGDQAPLEAGTARPSALIASVRVDAQGVLTVYDGDTAVCALRTPKLPKRLPLMSVKTACATSG